MAVQKRLCWVLNGMGACGFVLAVAATLVLTRDVRAGGVQIEDDLRTDAPTATVWPAAVEGPVLGARALQGVAIVLSTAVGVGGVVKNVRAMRH